MLRTFRHASSSAYQSSWACHLLLVPTGALVLAALIVDPAFVERWMMSSDDHLTENLRRDLAALRYVTFFLGVLCLALWAFRCVVTSHWKTVIFLLPLLFIGVVVFLKINAPISHKILMLTEDSFIENFTAIFYLLSCIFSFAILIVLFKERRFFVGIPYSFLSIGLWFVMMEEISWGQRIFHISTPDYFTKHNYQKELNLHNLSGVPLHAAYIVVGFYGAFLRIFIPKKIKRKVGSIIELFVPSWYLFFYFFTVFALYFYYDYASSILVYFFGEQFGWGKGRFMHAKDQEFAEFLLSCGFLLFLMVNKYTHIPAFLSNARRRGIQ